MDAKVKTKLKKVDKFRREDTTKRDAFMERCKTELGCEVKMVDVSNKEQPQEPVLFYKGKKIAWCAPRNGHLWTNYIFLKDGKEIHKIVNDSDIEADFQILKQQCEEIDKLPELKPRPKKKSKGNKNNVIAKLEERLERAKAGHGNGFSLKGIKVDRQVEKWVDGNGFRLSTNTVYFD